MQAVVMFAKANSIFFSSVKKQTFLVRSDYVFIFSILEFSFSTISPLMKVCFEKNSYSPNQLNEDKNGLCCPAKQIGNKRPLAVYSSKTTPETI